MSGVSCKGRARLFGLPAQETSNKIPRIIETHNLFILVLLPNLSITHYFVTGKRIKPLQAIETATKNNGEALRMDLKLGQIEEGYLADLIVVEGNPAEDISALEKVREVYLDGKCVKER